MSAGPLLLFGVASLAVAATPGPSWAFVIATVSRGGLMSGLLGIAGNCLGIVCHAGLAAVGLGAMLSDSTTAFTVLRWMGAGYLIWLGIGYLRAPVMKPTADSGTFAGHGVVFRSGLLVNLLNPKVPALMLAMLPQTVSVSAKHPILIMFGTGLLHALIAAGVLSMLAVLVARSQRFGSNSRMSRFLQSVCGPIMIAAGLLMLFPFG